MLMAGYSSSRLLSLAGGQQLCYDPRLAQCQRPAITGKYLEDHHVPTIRRYIAANMRSSVFGSVGEFLSKIPGPKLVAQIAKTPSGLMVLDEIGNTCVTLSMGSESVHRRVFRLANARNTDILSYYRFNV